MTTQEIREMLDSTINSNNTRGISGQSLNAALNAILDLVEQGGGASVGSGVTLLVPNDDTFAADNTSEELLENNKKVFALLFAQTTEPIQVYMRYLGNNILANNIMRIRYQETEEKSWYDYAYLVYSGTWVAIGRIYRFFSDGKVAEVDINGALLRHPDGVMMRYDLVGSYSQTANGESMSAQYLPSIRLSDDGLSMVMVNPFGSNLNNETAVPLDFVSDTKAILIGGWTHPTYGKCENDIVFSISGTTLTTKATLNGVPNYTMTKM